MSFAFSILSLNKMKKNPYIEIGNDKALSILKRRNPYSHKGDYGHALLMVGSYGKMGAAVLSSRACLRSGVGLLTTFVPRCGYNIMQITVPEAMVLCSEGETFIDSEIDTARFSAIGIGCGIGTHHQTAQMLDTVLSQYTGPMVLDADALNILALNPALLKKMSPNTVLTPHRKEFERLVGEVSSEEILLEKQLAFSAAYSVYVVLKGHKTRITSPSGEIMINTTGNAGMAKGGNGDVLTGIITALLAQGYSSQESSVLGVYIHGLAGDLAVLTKGEYALLASDLIEKLGEAFLSLAAMG